MQQRQPKVYTLTQDIIEEIPTTSGVFIMQEEHSLVQQVFETDNLRREAQLFLERPETIIFHFFEEDEILHRKNCIAILKGIIEKKPTYPS